MYSLALIIFVVSEKKAFEYFPIGSNVNLCPAVAAILNFRSAQKNHKLCRGPSNDYSWAVWFSIVQVVSEKKRFETFFQQGPMLNLVLP